MPCKWEYGKKKNDLIITKWSTWEISNKCWASRHTDEKKWPACLYFSSAKFPQEGGYKKRTALHWGTWKCSGAIKPSTLKAGVGEALERGGRCAHCRSLLQGLHHKNKKANQWRINHSNPQARGFAYGRVIEVLGTIWSLALRGIQNGNHLQWKVRNVKNAKKKNQEIGTSQNTDTHIIVDK